MKIDFSIEEIEEDKSKLEKEIQEIHRQMDSKRTPEEQEKLELELTEKYDMLLNIEEFCLEQSKKLIDDKHYDDYLQIIKMKSEIEDINMKYKYKTERIKKRIEDLERQIEEKQEKIALDNLQYNSKKTNVHKIHEMIEKSLDLQQIALFIWFTRNSEILKERLFEKSEELQKTWNLLNEKEQKIEIDRSRYSLAKIEEQAKTYINNNETKIETEAKEENAAEVLNNNAEMNKNNKNISEDNQEKIVEPKKNETPKTEQIEQEPTKQNSPQQETTAKEKYDEELEYMIDNIIKEVNGETETKDKKVENNNVIENKKTSPKVIDKIMNGINRKLDNDDEVIEKTPSESDKTVPDEVINEIIDELNPTLDDIDIEEETISEDSEKETDEPEIEPENESQEEITESAENVVTLTPEMRKRLERYKGISKASKIEKKVKRKITEEEYERKQESILDKIFSKFYVVVDDEEYDEELEGENYERRKSL